jgi:penicillin-binding protein 1C
MNRLSGGMSAADLAQAILLHRHHATRSDLTAGAFPAPPGRTPVELCTSSGAVAAPTCATRMTEYVAPATSDRPPPLGSDADPRLSIVSPAPETRVWRNPEVPAAMDRLVLRAQVSPAVHQIVWLVDGQTYALADPAAPLYWPTSPGVHRFQIRLPLQHGESRVIRVVVQ